MLSEAIERMRTERPFEMMRRSRKSILKDDMARFRLSERRILFGGNNEQGPQGFVGRTWEAGWRSPHVFVR